MHVDRGVHAQAALVDLAGAVPVDELARDVVDEVGGRVIGRRGGLGVDAQPGLLGGGVLGGSDVALLGHVVEDQVAARLYDEGVGDRRVLAGELGQGGQQRCLGEGHL